jgi:hypothetical protein
MMITRRACLGSLTMFFMTFELAMEFFGFSLWLLF